MTIHDAVDALEREDFSSEELVTAMLAEIRQRDPNIGAYIAVDEEYALTHARQADQVRSSGGGGRLLGVPILPRHARQGGLSWRAVQRGPRDQLHLP